MKKKIKKLKVLDNVYFLKYIIIFKDEKLKQKNF